jgi:ribosomal protein S18 acetylase RimI-like enzyme
MRIRPARSSDLPSLSGIAERAYGVYVERMGRRPRPMDDDYAEQVEAGGTFVADDDGVAGMIVLELARDHLLIANVAVDPARQREGIGRALLAFAESYARQNDRTVVRLYTNVAMTENIALYKRLGYDEIGRRVEQDFHRVYFRKSVE